MKKKKSIFIVSLTVLCILLAVMSALNGSANAQPQQDIKSQNSLKQKNNSSVSLSNYDASGNFRYLSGSNSGTALDIALDFIRTHSQELNVTANDLADLIVADQYTSQHNGVTHIYLQQQYQGLRIYNGFININIATDGSVINVGNRLVANLAAKVNAATPGISAKTAVQRAAQHLGLNITESLTVLDLVGGTAQSVVFSDGNISLNTIPVSLVYQPTETNSVQLAWDIEIYELDAQNYWSMRVDATTGDVINQHNLVIHEDFLEQAKEAGHAVSQTPAKAPSLNINNNAPDSYLVYSLPTESPHHTTPLPPSDGRVSVVDPANSASPFGWHDIDGSPGHESQFTIGNNVDAYEDTNNSNSPTGGDAARADGGATLDFNHPIDLTMAPSAYIPAAVTNLFYWNNIIHDVFHGYGFDEPSGNFQENNYGNGGLGSDYVQAEAQDGGGNCNANFGTQSDGSNPRMQMYTCTNASPARDGDLDNGVIIHEYGHGISNRLTGGPGQSGCLSNAEQMGEGWSDWAALLMTQEVGDAGTDSRGIGTWLFGQGPNGAGIRPTPYSTNMAINPTTYGNIGGLAIPHGVGYAWATMLWDMNWALIANHGFNPDIYGDWTTGGNNLNMQLVTDGMKLQPCNPGFVDGRDGILLADQLLTGGANQCTIWAAFANRGLGYSADQGSTNSTTDGTEAFDMPPTCQMQVTPVSQEICTGDTAVYVVDLWASFTAPVTMSSSGHPAGSTATFSSNPVNTVPGTTDLTISNTGGASAGSYGITITGTNGITTEAVMANLDVYTAVPGSPSLTLPADGAVDVSTNPTFVWTAAVDSTSYHLEVATNPGMTNLVYTATEVSTNHALTALFLDSLTTYYWRVTANNACGDGVASAIFSFTVVEVPGMCAIGTAPVIAYETDLEDGAPGWTHSGVGDTWVLTDTRTTSGSNAWYALDPETLSDQLLVSPPITVPSAIDTISQTLQFQNYQAFETPNSDGRCWDAGILEITTDAGSSWNQVPGSAMLTDPYDNIIWNNNPGNNPITNDYGATTAWCDESQPFLNSVVDISAYAGQTVQFRWRLGSDSAAGGEGWYLDDIKVQGCSATPPSIAVDPENLTNTQYPEMQVTMPLTISNNGGEDLDWMIEEAPGINNTTAASANLSHTDRAGADGIITNSATAAQHIPAAVNVPTFLGGFSEGFDDITNLPGNGWVQTNNSDPLGTTSWFQGNDGVFPAQSGAATSYIAANFQNAAGVGTVSNWLLTPEINLENNATLTFYTRSTDSGTFPDRLEVRMSTAGSSSDVGSTSTSVGDFTNLLLEINPTLTPGGYPNTWTEFTVTVSGLGAPTTGRLAFRYFVTNSGPSGSNGDYIGIDTVDYTLPPSGCDIPSDLPWVTVNPISGTVPAVSSTSVDVTFDSTGYAAGVYTGTLCANSNDPINPVVSVPLTMTVNELPAITITMPVSGTVLTALNGTDLDTTVAVSITNDFMIPTDGHWHLWVDGADTGPVMGYTGTANLTVGTHVISAQLQTPDHMPLDSVDTTMVEVVGADIVITAPADGAVFTATNGIDASVAISVTTPNFTIPTDGHWHLWVDGADTGPVMSDSTTISLTVGTHAITATLQTPGHMPLGPSDSISVTVAIGSFEIFLPFVVKE